MMKKIVNLVEMLLVIMAGHRFNSFIDLGCGAGGLVKPIKKYMPELNVWGVDICTPFIKYAKEDPQGVQFKKADVRKLPFKNKQFDLAFSLGLFIHIPPNDIEKAMKEAFRISKNFVFIESSLNLNEKATKKYDCEKYWNNRALKKEPDPKDIGIVYYFAHDYRRLFEKLGVEVEVTELDPTNNSRMYLKCKPNPA